MMNFSTTALPTVVLASTSRYRRELLNRLRVPFIVESPAVNEGALSGESPSSNALRLAQAKASAVAAKHPEAIVIGSDQIADLHGEAINKPGDHQTALAQLQRMQGQQVVFHTALAVIYRQRVLVDNVPTVVTFRRLDETALDNYLRLDQPYDCAGSAKIESLGIALLESVQSTDPTALIGLPLIRLTSMLIELGLTIPAQR